ncbi:MAG: hypothetical protein M3O46_22085, partial [Myxococcota bacterium]|nr:hypothetical protein [Myxococcota bacterium]
MHEVTCLQKCRILPVTEVVVLFDRLRLPWEGSLQRVFKVSDAGWTLVSLSGSHVASSPLGGNVIMKSSLVCPALLAGIVAAASPSFAVAQEQVAPPRAAETPSRPAGTSMMFVRSGIGLFTLSYLPAGVVGTTSRLKGDRSLVVPVAGPWLDLTQRPVFAAVIYLNGENT